MILEQATDVPKEKDPAVSVIVPCRNEVEHIASCITRLLALEAPPGGFEVIVADGMSDDGTREILAQLEREVRMGEGREKRGNGSRKAAVSGLPVLRRRTGTEDGWSVVSGSGSATPFRPSAFSLQPSPEGPPLRVIDNPGKIVSTGLNAALRAARGGIIIRIDAHTEYADDYIRSCVQILEQTGADNVGGPALTKAEGYLQQAVAAAYHSPLSAGGACFHDPNYKGYVDTVTYGCWPRSTFDKFGLFDEDLVRNQDDEHNLRITRGGGGVYQSPRIKSWYKPRSSLGALFKQYMQYGYWKVRVIQKHKLPASWRHLVPGGFVATLMLLFLLCAICFLLSAFAPVPWARNPIVLWSCAPLLLVLSSYLFAASLASLVTAAKTDWTLLPVLPIVFACYHFGYGCGFLRGILDFIMLRRGASTSFTRLTRGSPGQKVTAPTDH